MINSYDYKNEDGKYSEEAIVVKCGQDISATIGGGDKYHIGAMAIGVPRKEFNNDEKRKCTASTSVICVLGHREDELSYNVAKYLATELNCTVTVVSIGIHIDNINQHD